jgi:hypothetical protein
MKTTKLTKSKKTTMEALNLESSLKDWILMMADEQNLAVDIFIETSIRRYVEQEKIIADELMRRYFGLSKSIRKIIAQCFYVANEDYMESEGCCFLDDDYLVLVDLTEGKTGIKFSSRVERLFTDFLKTHDVFNAEV